MVKKDFIEEVTPGRSQETSDTYQEQHVGNSTADRGISMCQGTEGRKENGWSCPDPGTWVAEWETTQKPVGTDNAERHGKKETLEGTSAWGAGRKASHSLPELQ